MKKVRMVDVDKPEEVAKVINKLIDDKAAENEAIDVYNAEVDEYNKDIAKGGE